MAKKMLTLNAKGHVLMTKESCVILGIKTTGLKVGSPIYE